MLLEREELVGALLDRVDDAANGSGSFVLIAGEAGVGKTSLVGSFVDSLDRSTLVMWGACDPFLTPRPLGPFHDLAADREVGLDDLLDAGEWASVAAGLLDRLRTSIRPVVLVIEDVHWADAATLDVLRFLGRRIADSHAVVVVTYRDDELAPRHPLRHLVGELSRFPSTHRIEVPRLSIEAVETLAGAGEVDVAGVYARTGGNAFFVTEVLATGATVPETVQDAVLARLATLDDGGRRVAELTSLSPRSLEVDRARAITGLGSDVVDGALGSGVLVADGTTLRFRHELARVAVEESLTPALSTELHRAMITSLELDPDRDTIRLAHHAVRAGDPDLIVEHAPRAAELAIDRGGRREAIAFLDAALAHEGSLEVQSAAELWRTLGNQLVMTNENRRAAAALQRSIELYRSVGDDEGAGRALVRLQSPVVALHGMDQGAAHTEEAIELLRPLGPTSALAFALLRKVHNHMIAREKAAALTVLAEASEVARAAGWQEMVWRADMLDGTIEIVMGDAALGVEKLSSSVEAAEAMGDHELVGLARGMLGSGAGEARQYEAALPALDLGVAHAQATDDDNNLAYNRAWLGRVAFEQGRWDDASRLVDEALRAGSSHSIAVITAECVQGRLRVRRGDPGGIEVLLGVVEGADDELFQYVWNAYCGLAEHAWLTGDPDAAADVLPLGFARAMASDSPWGRGEVGFWMWRLGLIDRAPDGAAQPFALQIEGAWSEAAEAWGQIGCPYEMAMALADGDEPSMREALAILDGLGATPAASRVRATMRNQGITNVPRGPSRSTREDPAGLTQRQREVLALVVQGRSNQEIADTLFVSKKTVEHHVAAVYQKLDVDSRARAIAVALERGLVET